MEPVPAPMMVMDRAPTNRALAPAVLTVPEPTESEQTVPEPGSVVAASHVPAEPQQPEDCSVAASHVPAAPQQPEDCSPVAFRALVAPKQPVRFAPVATVPSDKSRA